MAFTLSHDLLRAICARNLFPIPDTGMVFFGLRGCLPLDPEDHSFSASRELKVVEVNYENPRCTLGQWMPAAGKLAVFPGSTCPNSALVASAKDNEGQGANQLLTGYYTFVKGEHHLGKPSGHKAFRQEEDRVVLRNTDDKDFDFHDALSSGVQFDNLHCGFSAGVTRGYSSAGCQVVVGFPNRNDGQTKESGPWAVFRQNAYKLSQDTFRYILLRGSEVEAMAQNPNLIRPVTIRFGSTGELVRDVQKMLRQMGLVSFVPDASCGPGTQMAIVRLQIDKMGSENADGILGANTAVQLGITDWPTVGAQPAVDHDGTPLVIEAAPVEEHEVTATPSFKFASGYKLPKYAQAAFGAEAGIPWDGAEPVPDWNEYEGFVKGSGYAFPKAPVAALFYEAKFAIDADGVAAAAATDKTGQGDTTLHDRNDRGLDSNKVPFIVLPLNQQVDKHGVVHKIAGRTLNQMGAQLGDLGVVLYKNGKVVPVLFGDRGPALRLGEGSMIAARSLGIDDDPNRGGIDAGQVPPGIVYLVFPGSTDAPNKVTQRGPKEIARDAIALYDKFRGA